MVSIRNEKFVKYEDNLSVVRVRINVDSADELPETDDFSGKILYQGSTARDLSTGDLYALTSSGEWIKQSASSGGQGMDNYNDLSNKPQINGVTLQGNKSLSDIGTYSKAEIDGMTEIETIDLIHDETEDKYYFPAEKRYILEKHKPFFRGYDSTSYLDMCAFSNSNIYDDGQGNIDGGYIYQFGTEVNEDSGTFDYYTMFIDVRTLEVTINNYYVDNQAHTVSLTAATGVTLSVTGSFVYASNYESLADLNHDSYYLDFSLTIQGTFQNGDTIAVAGESIGTVIIPAILYRNNEYSAINLFLLGTDLKTFSNLESGDMIYVNHTIHKVYKGN